MTLSPKEPLVATQVNNPSKKRSHSSSLLKSHHKRHKDPLRAITKHPATDSQKSGVVELVPTRPREIANLIPSSSVSSQQVSVENMETHIAPSSTNFLVDEDDLGLSPAQGTAFFSPHSLSLDTALPDKGNANFLDFLVENPLVKHCYLSGAEGEKIPDITDIIFTSARPERCDRPGPSNPSKSPQTGPSVKGEQHQPSVLISSVQLVNMADRSRGSRSVWEYLTKTE